MSSQSVTHITPSVPVDADDKPRVLFIGVGEPGKGGAGYLVRQRMLLDALSQCADVQLALFDVPAEMTQLESWPVTPLPMPETHQETWIEARLNDVFSLRPMMLRWKKFDQARGRIAGLDPGSYDAIVAYRVDFAYFAGVLGQPHLIIDIDDPEHLRRRDRLQTIGRGLRDWYAWIDLLRLRHFERSAVSNAAAAFVCQERDQRAFADPKPLIVPNCVDAPATRPARRVAQPVLTFVGNLAGSLQTPNLDGLVWFLNDVWPLVIKTVPACDCRVVGPVSQVNRDQLEGYASVRVDGFVPSVADVLHESSLSIAPIRFGTGTRIKILESMAEGCPVVSTTKGCEGIDCEDERELLVADSPAEFADRCVRLLTDAAQQERLAIAGHALIRASYDRATQQQRLVGQFRALIETARDRRLNAR